MNTSIFYKNFLVRLKFEGSTKGEGEISLKQGCFSTKKRQFNGISNERYNYMLEKIGEKDFAISIVVSKERNIRKISIRNVSGEALMYRVGLLIYECFFRLNFTSEEQATI